MIVEETWYDIPEFEGLYQGSNTFKIRSVSRMSQEKNTGYWKPVVGKELKFQYVKGGYVTVGFCKNGVVKTMFVHKIFATLFMPNPENKKFVNHKNANKWDFNLDNLEWATKSEDLQHAYDNKLKVTKKGKDSPIYGTKRPFAPRPWKAKLVLHTLTGIFYDGCTDAAKVAGISHQSLSKYLTGKRPNKTGFIYV